MFYKGFKNNLVVNFLVKNVFTSGHPYTQIIEVYCLDLESRFHINSNLIGIIN